ncbi:MAG: manganese efflux pump MntP family protein [Christensenellaceae bacterium]|jgi:putative Mn2+ efflux pump MntP
MDVLSFVLIGVSLSMDALAVSISTGISCPHMRKRDAAKIGVYFGGFQFLMPVLGWLLGTTVSFYIAAFDHWVAFGLLAFVGIKMIHDALKSSGGSDRSNMLSNKVLLTMALATSIDALAVGLSFGVIGTSSVWLGAAIIGLTTFCLCFAGAVFGKKLGEAFEKKAMVIGGLVLVGIGVKILVELSVK